MNDEEFARAAFNRSLGEGFPGEPTTLPTIERITVDGRRAARSRRGAYAVGTTVLAGAVTAGVVVAPNLLPSPGAPSLSGSGDASGSPAAPSSPPVKPKGMPCTDPPNVDWSAILASDLPGVALTPSPPTCVQDADGVMDLQVSYALQGGATLQIEASFGTSAAKTAPPMPTPTGSAARGWQTGSAGSAGSAAPKAGESAAEGAPSNTVTRKLAASKQAEASRLAAAGGNTVVRASASNSCGASSGSNETVCGGEFVKGPLHGIEAAVSGTSLPGSVQVVVTAPEAGTTTSPNLPLTKAQISTIARDVYDQLSAAAGS